jgi:two-component system LytT family response regulator
MIRTLIIDDNLNNRLHLSGMIRDFFPNISVMGEADGVQTGIQAINKLRPELVLLDIKMADGDAFDLLKQIENIFFRIIFVTAYEEYAMKAIKFSALDYLLKPVTVEDLKIALDKAENQILNDLKLQLSTLQLNTTSSKNKTIVLRTSDKIYLVEVMEIIRCESDGNYTMFFTKEGQKYMVSNPMKEYEDILGDHGFFRIHKSHIVNTSFINSYDKEGYVVLKDKTMLPVSKRKKGELLELFTRL